MMLVIEMKKKPIKKKQNHFFPISDLLCLVEVRILKNNPIIKAMMRKKPFGYEMCNDLFFV